MKTLISILLVFLSSAFFFSAQLCADSDIETLDILNIGTTIDGKAQMQMSASIEGLDKDSLSIYVDNDKINDFSFKTDSSSQISVIAVVDISGSMKGQPIFDAKKWVSSLLYKLDNSDVATLITFGEEVKILAQFSQDRGQIEKRVDALEADDRKTKLYQAIYLGLDTLAMSPSAANVIVVFTDGNDEGSAVTKDELLERLKYYKIPIYAVGLGDKSQEHFFLTKLSTATGGAFFPAPTFDNFTKLSSAVLNQKQNIIKIAFDFTKPAGQYTVTVNASKDNKSASAKKEFTHILPSQPQQQEKTADYLSALKQIEEQIKEIAGKSASIRTLIKQEPSIIIAGVLIVLAVLFLLALSLAHLAVSLMQKTRTHNQLDKGFNNLNRDVAQLKSIGELKSADTEKTLFLINERLQHADSSAISIKALLEALKIDTQMGFKAFSDVIKASFAAYIEERISPSIERSANRVEIGIDGINKNMLGLSKDMASSASLDRLQNAMVKASDSIRNGLNELNIDMKTLNKELSEVFLERISLLLDKTIRPVETEIDVINKSIETINKKMISLDNVPTNTSMEIIINAQDKLSQKMDDLETFVLNNSELMKKDTDRSEQKLEHSIQSISKELQVLIQSPASLESSLTSYVEDLIQKRKEDRDLFTAMIKEIKEGISEMAQKNETALYSIIDILRTLQDNMLRTDQSIKTNEMLQNEVKDTLEREISLLKEGMIDVMRFLAVLSKKTDIGALRK
ncbi:von Willebrand factor type A domain-containing protein [Candidatus Magnetoovum chiemensis]|nr:von Willebrand factor type A domain-containing protein [Candidatus Magnetoovum chiemensis]